jgi:hypothetical protein
MDSFPPGGAIIFDRFGTLVDTFSFQRHEHLVTTMAMLLDVPHTDFALWYGKRTGEGRLQGNFPLSQPTSSIFAASSLSMRHLTPDGCVSSCADQKATS